MPVYEPLSLPNGVRTTTGEMTLLEKNFCISPEVAKTMNKDDFLSWQVKLAWLTNQVTYGFSRYDICKELYGLSYEQVVALPSEEFLPMVKPVETVWRRRRKEM